MATNEKWFSRGVGEKRFDVTCPNCKRPWHVSPLFDHHPTPCAGCGRILVELNLMEQILLIDQDAAPHIVQTILRELRPLGEPDACDVVVGLVRLLNPSTVL